MATEKDIKNQKELNQEKNSSINLQENFNKKIADHRSILREINSEIGKSASAYGKAASVYRQFDSIASKLLDKNGKISNLNSKELKSLKEKADLGVKELENNAQIILKKLGLQRLSEKSIKIREKNGTLDEKEAAILRGRIDGFETEKEFVKTVNKEYEDRLNFEEKTAKAGGATRALIKSSKGFMDKLGLSSLANFLNIEKAEQAMQEQAEAAMEAGEEIDDNKIKAAGLEQLLLGATDAMFSMENIGRMVLNSFASINEQAVSLGRNIGQANVSFNNLNTTIATTTDLLKTANALTEETGLSAQSIFSNEQLARIAEAEKLLGLSSEQTTALAIRMKQTGMSSEDFTSGLTDGISSANELGESIVAPGIALKDALSTAEDISLSLGNNPIALGKAATAARALGLELSKVDDIADGLLDFESSIQNELEAQLLTGKNINLAKAREFALNNDLAGLSAELAKNGASAAEFANMNRIAQNSLANALGMSREELANMLILQDTQGKLTDEQKQKILGVNAEQLKGLTVQQSINDSIAKLTELLAGPLAAMAQLASYSTIMYGTLGLIAGISFTKFIGSLALMVTQLSASSALAITTSQALTLGLSAIAIATGIGLIYGAMKKNQNATQTGDLQINPNGGPVVMSPREGGLYQGTKNDALTMAPPGAMGGSNKELIEEIRALRAVVEKGGDVVMDGSKVGQAIVMGSYKLS